MAKKIELYNENCEDTMKRIKTGSVDLLLQDTPFGCTQNEWDVKPDFAKMWLEWERVTKENGAMIFFGTQPFASELILSRAGLFRYDIIWYKALGTGHLNANKMPKVERIDTTWWEVKRQMKHSKKPEFFQDLIEQVSEAPRLEMFARREREGWDVFGNEVNNSVDLERYRSNGI